MKVKILVSFVDVGGPSPIYARPSEVLDVPEELANQWITANFAVPFIEAPQPETAALKVPAPQSKKT
jgi:hypothetical protein